MAKKILLWSIAILVFATFILPDPSGAGSLAGQAIQSVVVFFQTFINSAVPGVMMFGLLAPWTRSTMPCGVIPPAMPVRARTGALRAVYGGGS